MSIVVFSIEQQHDHQDFLLNKANMISKCNTKPVKCSYLGKVISVNQPTWMRDYQISSHNSLM